MSNLLVYILLYVGLGLLYTVGMAMFVVITRCRRYGISKVSEFMGTRPSFGSASGRNWSTIITNLAFWPICVSTSVAEYTRRIDDYCER